jgi:hypothetical protein
VARLPPHRSRDLKFFPEVSEREDRRHEENTFKNVEYVEILFHCFRWLEEFPRQKQPHSISTLLNVGFQETQLTLNVCFGVDNDIPGFDYNSPMKLFEVSKSFSVARYDREPKIVQKEMWDCIIKAHKKLYQEYIFDSQVAAGGAAATRPVRRARREPAAVEVPTADPSNLIPYVLFGAIEDDLQIPGCAGTFMIKMQFQLEEDHLEWFTGKPSVHFQCAVDVGVLGSNTLCMYAEPVLPFGKIALPGSKEFVTLYWKLPVDNGQMTSDHKAEITYLKPEKHEAVQIQFTIYDAEGLIVKQIAKEPIDTVKLWREMDECCTEFYKNVVQCKRILCKMRSISHLLLWRPTQR